MTIRKYVQATLAVCAVGCSQGPSWLPPEDDDVVLDAGTEAANQAHALSGLEVEVVTPFQDKGCARVGDFVQLGASVTAKNPVSVKWSFEREQVGCAPVTLAVLDSPTIHTDAYSMFMWGTSCAMDIPNECGVGAGTIGIEVTAENGEVVEDRVPFCLDAPVRVEQPTVATAE